MLKEEQDPELSLLIKSEISSIEHKIEQCSISIDDLLTESDPNDNLDVIVEMRPAAGGQEAALFVGELYAAYYNLAQHMNWNVDINNSNVSELKGFNLLTFSVTGDKVYGMLKHESGVHRVQRVPETESIGRVHTSTITVSVLPQTDDEVKITLNEDELRIDTFRASGNGGQSVQKNATAVRIVHKPTGITVVCQDERSLNRNKRKSKSKS